MPSHESLEDITTHFIPETLPAEYRTKPRYFTRKSKLSVKQIIGFVLSSVASGRKNGVRGQAHQYLTDQCLCPVLSDYQSVHFTNVQKSRYKISDTAFTQIFDELVDSVYAYWDDTNYNFGDMAVVAFDGSQYTLPGSDEIRKEYDDVTPLLEGGGRYFPQALVMTAFDVFRKIPVGRTISNRKASERTELLKMMADLRVKTLAVLDRGYYGYEVFCRIINEMEHEFLAKVPMNNSFKELSEFVATGKSEGFVTIHPTEYYIKKMRRKKAKMVEHLVPITLRVIRTSLGEEEFILMTSLLDEDEYPTDSFLKLYQARWEVENYYRDEKTWLDVEEFMTESLLGVKQELFATLIMSLVTRVRLYLEGRESNKKGEPQYYTAITSFAKAIPRVIALGKERGKVYIKNLLKGVVSIRYYRPTRFRSFPRICRGPRNKWKAVPLRILAK